MGFFRKGSALRSTGHPADDQVLDELARKGDLNHGRRWVHYFYAADEAGAREASRRIEAAGWQLNRVDAAADGNGWVVIVEQHGAVTSPEAVSSARDFFEDLATRTPGGEYDGWQASL